MRTRQGHLVKRGAVWSVQYRVGGKLFQRSTGKTNRKDAEIERARIMAPFSSGTEREILEGVAGRIGGLSAEISAADEERNPPLAVVEGWRSFLAAPGRPDSGEVTLSRYGCQWGAFVAWLGKHHPRAVRLRDVTAEIAGEYAAHLHATRGAGTVNKHVSACALIFRTLRVPARMEVNPFGRDTVRRLRHVQAGRRELTLAELRQVCEAAKGDLRPLFALGLYTGLRLADCATLRWGEVDLERGIIRRIPNKTARRNPQPVLIPIHPALRAILAECRRSGAYVIPSAAAQCLDNEPTLSRRIQAHFVAVGICTVKPGTGGKTGKRAVVEVGFYSMRHSFVSLCRAAGAPLSVVESIVGHSSPAMTRHYTHTGEEGATAAIASLPSVTGNVLALPAPARAPLPAWARTLLESATPETWSDVRAELLR